MSGVADPSTAARKKLQPAFRMTNLGGMEENGRALPDTPPFRKSAKGWGTRIVPG